MTVDEIQADILRMKRFVSERVPADNRIVLADGPEGTAWADLWPVWDDDGDCDLLIETNEPEWVNLYEVHDYFRRKEMTWAERMREATKSLQSGVGHVPRLIQQRTRKITQPNASTTLTVNAAAAELNCSISFVYKLMYIGELIYEKRGRRKLPTVASIAEYRERNVVRASQRFDYPKRNAHEPYQYQQLFKKAKREKRGT